MPLRSRRCFIHPGVGARASMPSSTRAQKRGHASGASTRTPRVVVVVLATCACGGGLTGDAVIAPTSRAMPASERQSARLGVSFSVSNESSRSSTWRRSVPMVALPSSTSSPDASSAMPSSAAEQSMPCDSTPRIAALRITMPPGSSAPTSAHGTRMPGATLGAPHTIDSGAPRPASTLQTVRRSAFGWRSTVSTLATTTCVKGGAARTCSSTSSPAIVSAWASASLSSGGSTSVRSQRSENLMMAYVASGELAQEAQVVFIEQPQIVHSVAQHGQAVRAHAEGEALIALRIDAHRLQHVGVDLTGAGDLEPAVAEAHVDLGRRFCEREERWPKAHLQIVAFEESAKEFGEDAFQIRERDVFVDPQTLDLVEHGRMRGVAVDAIHAPWRDDLDRRLVRFHVPHLDRRGVRAQYHATFDVERVVHRAGGVVLGRVQR